MHVYIGQQLNITQINTIVQQEIITFSGGKKEEISHSPRLEEINLAFISGKHTSGNNTSHNTSAKKNSCHGSLCLRIFLFSQIPVHKLLLFLQQRQRSPFIFPPTKRSEFHEDHLLRHNLSRFKSTKAQSKPLKFCVHRELQNQCINNLRRCTEHFQKCM